MGNTHPAVQAAADAMGLKPVLRIEAASIEVATKAIRAFLKDVGVTAYTLEELAGGNDLIPADKRVLFKLADAIRAVQDPTNGDESR